MSCPQLAWDGFNLSQPTKADTDAILRCKYNVPAWDGKSYCCLANKLNADVMLIWPLGLKSCMVNQLNLYVLQLKHPYSKLAENVDVSTVTLTNRQTYILILSNMDRWVSNQTFICDIIS